MSDTEAYYIVFGPSGRPVVESLSADRQTAKGNFLDTRGVQRPPWSEFQKHGFRLRKVRIVELAGETG